MIRLEELSKHYQMGKVVVKALNKVSLTITAGEMVGIVGPSGSGKSTLMNILGCLDVPTAGKYYLDGREVSELNEDELAEIRNRKIGFVFQNFNLLPSLTALENVELPLIYRGLGGAQRRQQALVALEKVGLSDRVDHKPVELSGGQQQRVAIVRALAGDPPVILADEPTGNLDSRSGREVMEILTQLHQQGKTIIIITHDPEIAARLPRVVRIHDGMLSAEEGRA